METESQKIIKEYLLKAPKPVKTMVASNFWIDMTDKIGKQFNLNELKIVRLRNQMLFVLIGLEPRTDFAENIKREVEIDSNMASWIAEDVDKNIFSKVAEEIDSMRQTESIESAKEKPEQNQTKNSIGQSFEQIILNQAKAMREAVPANLPIENSAPKSEAPKITIPDYSSGDPYREPTE